jgi:hypothetical protein
MVKLILKTLFVILFVCCTTFIAKAQLGYNFSQYDLGAAAGFNQVFGDAQTNTTTQSIHFNFTFNQTPYTNFVFEAQLGRLEGGDSLKTSTGRQFTNDFSAFIFRGQLQLGEFIDYSRSPLYNGLKNFYISAGIGYVVNHITNINRFSIQNPGFYTGGQNNSNEPFVPIRIGYEFKIFNTYQQPTVKVDLAYEYNLILGDGLDGFSSGSHHDVYTQFILGVKFAIGAGNISYRKQINY